MYKKSSAKIPMLTGMTLGAILLYKLFYTFYSESPNDPVGARNFVAISAGVGGAVIGLILGLIVYSMFKPRQTNRPFQDQNRNHHNNNSKTDELIRLSGLKDTGAISDQEFRSLKSEIINRR